MFDCAGAAYSRRRGRIARLGAVLLFATLMLTFAGGRASAQISPGPLSKAHQDLNGSTKCTSCHQFGTSTPTFKCLDCHKEISKLLSDGHGYHARLGMKNPNSKDCVRCHLEHNGLDFTLVRWQPSVREFDHKQTGYALEGKHAGVACEKCHTAGHISAEFKTLIKYKDVARTYVGLSTKCISCHEDFHKGQLGPECQSCHNVSDWKAAKQFDHSKTRYPLTGMHTNVKCELCHKPDVPGGPARFKDMNFATCKACHVDPHHGEFKQACEECHTTASWKNVLPGFSFDHSKTKYPLLGKHTAVGCTACHVSGDFKKPLEFDMCVDCHKVDAHGGQFAGRPMKGECAECHNLDGWKPSLFGVKEHATSKYPLEGKHATVECDKCHIPAGKDTVYKMKFAACLDCHKDAHDGQFAAAPYQNRCESCHTVADFHRSTFTIAKHGESKYPLTGSHVAVPCMDCHKIGAGGRTDKILPFHFADQSCTACHVDPHHGEFKERMERKRADGTSSGCEACHNTRSWGDVEGFDHSKTNFPLLGAHRAIQCEACHKPQQGTQGNLFKGAPRECQGCHLDPHAGQFAQQQHDGTTACASCHNEQRWVPSTFDHEKRTRFPLKGGHTDVACDKCHMLTKDVGGKAVLFYKPTPMKCEACHTAGKLD
jgi:hypothetical protein